MHVQRFLSVLACEYSCIHTTQCSNMFFLGNRVRPLSQVIPVRFAASPRLIFEDKLCDLRLPDLMSAPASAPPPLHIIRSHSSAVSALFISGDNERIYSGDVSGLVVITSTRSLRSVASWKAHTDGLLGVEEWGKQVITSVCGLTICSNDPCSTLTRFYLYLPPSRHSFILPCPLNNQKKKKVTVETTNCMYGSSPRRFHPPSADLRLHPVTRSPPSSATR